MKNMDEWMEQDDNAIQAMANFKARHAAEPDASVSDFMRAYDRRTTGSTETLPEPETTPDVPKPWDALSRAEERADVAHDRTLKFARKAGVLQGHLLGMRAELAGLRAYVETYPEGLPVQYATDFLGEQFEQMISRINQILNV